MRRQIVAALVIALLVSTPALAELTDYQRGVQAGLQVGLFMGELRGMGRYTLDSANQFNSYLSSFEQFLFNTFKENETAINEFRQSPLAAQNKVTVNGPIPDANGRIGEYPAEAFYTATGSGPIISSSTSDALGGA
jgi:hypothetical protein